MLGLERHGDSPGIPGGVNGAEIAPVLLRICQVKVPDCPPEVPLYGVNWGLGDVC